MAQTTIRKNAANNIEDARHLQAFELYASLGQRRSYRRVAGQMGVSVSTIKLWSKQQGWRERIVEREVQAARQLSDSVQGGPDSDNVRNLKIVRVALMKVAKAIAAGSVRIQMGDLDRLVKLEERLTGVLPTLRTIGTIQRSVQAQTASKFCLMVSPGPYSPAKEE